MEVARSAKGCMSMVVKVSGSSSRGYPVLLGAAANTSAISGMIFDFTPTSLFTVNFPFQKPMH